MVDPSLYNKKAAAPEMRNKNSDDAQMADNRQKTLTVYLNPDCTIYPAEELHEQFKIKIK